MELDWSTLVLEVINFLILIWLLKRFLYRPVLNVIETRRQKIEAELAQAAHVDAQASALKEQFEARLADWETEKRAARDDLEQQIALEQGKRMQHLDEELAQQRLKYQARDQQQQAQWRSQAEAEALQLGAAFATRLLQTLSCPELDRHLQKLFIEQLSALPDSAIDEMRRGWDNEDVAKIEVISAVTLDEPRQQQIRQALERRLGTSSQWQFSCDEQLIAGLRISVSGWTLAANLQDELRFFKEAAALHE